MIVVLAFVFLITPMVVEHVWDRAEKRRGGPLVEPVFADPGDADRCATESRLARELLDGTLDRSRYHAEMAALAAGV